MSAERVDEIIDRYGADRAASLAVLQEIQQAFNYLPREALEQVALRLNIEVGEVYHLATFYRSFSLRPRGKYCVRVCLGTACHVHGGPRILEAFEREMGIKAGESTADGLFSLEATACMGACAQAPYVLVNEEPYIQVDPVGVAGIVKTCSCGEAEKAA